MEKAQPAGVSSVRTESDCDPMGRPMPSSGRSGVRICRQAHATTATMASVDAPRWLVLVIAGLPFGARLVAANRFALPVRLSLGDRITFKDLRLVHEHMGRHTADAIVPANKRFAKLGPMLHMADDDLQKIVDTAAYMRGLDDFRCRRKHALKTCLLVGRPSLESDLDEQDKAYIDAKRVKARVIALNDAESFEPTYARETGARREGDARRERLVGESRLFLEKPQNLRSASSSSMPPAARVRLYLRSNSRNTNRRSIKMSVSENLWTLVFAVIVAVGLPTVILAVTLSVS